MYCKKCGKEMQNNSNFCVNCGTKVDSSSPIKDQNTIKSEEKLDNTKNPDDSKAPPPQMNKDLSNKDQIATIKKKLKNTGTSLSAVGWLTIIISVGFLLWSILDSSFYEYELPAGDFSGTFLTVVLMFCFIIFGNRIKEGDDINTKTYLQITLLISIIVFIFAMSSGGMVGLIYFLVLFYIISSISAVNKIIKMGEFDKNFKKRDHKINKKEWIIIAISSVTLFIALLIYDMRPTNEAESIDLEQVVAEGVATMNNELDLPIMIDEITQLTKVSSQGTTFVYEYKIVDSELEMTQNDLDLYLKDELAQNYCTDPNIRPLLDMGIDNSLNYFDVHGNKIGQITIQKSDCL